MKNGKIQKEIAEAVRFAIISKFFWFVQKAIIGENRLVCLHCKQFRCSKFSQVSKIQLFCSFFFHLDFEARFDDKSYATAGS